jgi:hypothetical protein
MFQYIPFLATKTQIEREKKSAIDYQAIHTYVHVQLQCDKILTFNFIHQFLPKLFHNIDPRTSSGTPSSTSGSTSSALRCIWRSSVGQVRFGATRDRCYDFINIFAKKIAKKLAFLTQNKA